jgi:hypothetical protein
LESDKLPPPIALLQLITGRWVSQTIGVAAELGFADEIESGPKTAAEIASAKDLHAPSVYRVLRALASIGIFAEQDGRFMQTPLSDALRSDVPYSMRGLARMVNMNSAIDAWNAVEHCVRTGGSGFEHAHGMQAFAYFDQHPADREMFANGMSSLTAQVGTAVAQAYDFSSMKMLADIGGSHGMVLALVLAKYPELRGTLFDRPGVVADAKPVLDMHGVAGRVACIGGDFFESVPTGADAYLMKHILHDWNDLDAGRILATIHRAAAPGSKLLIVEAIVEEGNTPQFAKFLDIEVMAMTPGGHERTLEQWQTLLQASGYAFSRVVPTPTPVVVIEAIRV